MFITPRLHFRVLQGQMGAPLKYGKKRLTFSEIEMHIPIFMHLSLFYHPLSLELHFLLMNHTYGCTFQALFRMRHGSSKCTCPSF